MAIFMALMSATILGLIGPTQEGVSGALFSCLSFLWGALTSILAGALGMSIAVYSNARTTVMCARGCRYGFEAAFRGGAVMGFALTSLGVPELPVRNGGRLRHAFEQEPEAQSAAWDGAVPDRKLLRPMGDRATQCFDWGGGGVTTTRRRWTNRNVGVKTAAWQTFSRRSTLHHAVKNKRVTVQGPVKKPQMDYMSHSGSLEPPAPPPLRNMDWSLPKMAQHCGSNYICCFVVLGSSAATPWRG